LVFLNPCRYLQAPPLDHDGLPPIVYFCDEPRRVDNEPAAAAERNSLTRPLYEPIYQRERRLDQRATRAVDAIATNSHYTAGEIERVYGRNATVLPMGTSQTPLEVPSLARETFLLSVGRLIPNKGHEIVIAAAAACAVKREVRVVAPRPDRGYQARLEQLARTLDVPLVIQTGVSDAELIALYRRAFATLYLARREPLGLVSLEAQAEGCPVIVADEGGLPETVKHGISGWICPRDAASAARLLDRLAQGDTHASMSEAARLNAKDWSWDESASQLIALFESTISATGRGPTD
jgi:glycosyltransferase involved in cell wall biosynthesis